LNDLIIMTLDRPFAKLAIPLPNSLQLKGITSDTATKAMGPRPNAKNMMKNIELTNESHVIAVIIKLEKAFEYINENLRVFER